MRHVWMSVLIAQGCMASNGERGGTAADQAGFKALPTSACQDESPGETEGDCLPDGTFRAADGTTATLGSSAGKVIVIDLSTVWCSICRNFADHGQGLLDQYGTEDLAVFTALYEGDDVGVDASTDQAATWADGFGLSHPVWVDEGAAYRDFFGGRERPLLLVADADGRIVSRSAASATTVDAAVADLLGE